MLGVSLTMQGMRASIPVSIKGQKADMWIDTGAFFHFMSRAKAAQLGEDEPHPVRRLAPALQLGERGFVYAVLRHDEAFEIVGHRW